MTLKELAASREKIIEYYKDREKTKAGYDELKEKNIVKHIFPDLTLTQEEEFMLQSFLNSITNPDYSTESYVNDALDLAEDSKFCDCTIAEDDRLKHISDAVFLGTYFVDQLEDEITHSKEYAQIYETFISNKLTQQDPYILEMGLVPQYERLLKKDKEVVSGIENNITELQQILDQQGMKNEAQQVSLFIEQMTEMQKNYNVVFQELKTIRNQLNQLQGMPQNSEKQSIIVNQLSAFEKGVQKQYQQFQDMRKQIKEKAGILVQKFKEIGIKALNNVCGFLGIKENLIKMRDMTQSNAVKTKGIIEKIDSIGNEVKNASVHIKNIGRTITGKEVINSASTKQFDFFQGLKKHYIKNMIIYENGVDKLNIAIKKVANLEQVAGKASIRQKLEDNKAVIVAKEAVELKLEKEKPHQEFTL